MTESLVLFESVINSRWFLRTSIILFLNKTDVFKHKLMKVLFLLWPAVTLSDIPYRSLWNVISQNTPGEEMSTRLPNISSGSSCK